jgi:hypothetical protein
LLTITKKGLYQEVERLSGVTNSCQKTFMALKFSPRRDCDDPPPGRSPFIMKGTESAETSPRREESVGGATRLVHAAASGKADLGDETPLTLGTKEIADTTDNSAPTGDKAVAQETADPLVQGLVARLPKPDSTWSMEDRVKWLRAAANIFVLIYKAHDGENRELKIVLDKDETATSH